MTKKIIVSRMLGESYRGADGHHKRRINAVTVGVVDGCIAYTSRLTIEEAKQLAADILKATKYD